MSDIEIEIDGKPLKAKPNSMIIQVADEAGIYIPRFCYHKHLSIAANCRMCLVEVEKAPKPAPACATPVMPGMKVFTRSPKALAAQRAVMEFLLINHPLDCPICDQGGECELQDLSLGYGTAESYYTFGKRSVLDENLGPLIETEMTRCIQCTRCVRFGDEIAGLRELGAINRGEDMEISTYVEKTMRSEISGNIIDLCPVGALTSKPFRYTARAWELIQNPGIAAHDCLGSNINIHTRTGRVMRTAPRENREINLTWMSDRDRFSYRGIYHPERLSVPMIRVQGEWQETDWETALEFASRGLFETIQQNGPKALGALASPNSTVEEFYLLQKLMRTLGSQSIDYRLRQVDFSDQDEFPLYPSTEIAIADIETCDHIILVGSHISKEQPLLGVRVRKAALNGAKVTSINMMDYKFNFPVSGKKIAAPHEFVTAMAGIVKALAPNQATALSVEVSELDREIAASLQNGGKVAILLGATAINHPEAAMIRSLAITMASAVNGKLALLTEGANAAGAWLTGVIPHRSVKGKTVGGLNAKDMLDNPLTSYILLNVEPDMDCANPGAAAAALSQAKHVVALSLYRNKVLERNAHVILPMASFGETSGTFVNIEGRWQSFTGVGKPVGEARPAWKILRVLGNFLHLNGFDYESSEEVINEVKSYVSPVSLAPWNKEIQLAALKPVAKVFSRIGEIPIYSGDSLVRHADALQETQKLLEGDLATVRLHPKTAANLNLHEGEVVTVIQLAHEVRLPLRLDERLPLNGVYVVGAVEANSGLGELFGQITVNK